MSWIAVGPPHSPHHKPLTSRCPHLWQHLGKSLDPQSPQQSVSKKIPFRLQTMRLRIKLPSTSGQRWHTRKEICRLTSKFKLSFVFEGWVRSPRSLFKGGADGRWEASGTVARAAAFSLSDFASKRLTARSCSASISSGVFARCTYTAASMGGSTRLVNACSAPAPSRSWSLVHFHFIHEGILQ